jgi:transposase
MAVNIVCLGIDLAKNVFALHGVDAAGCVALRRPSMFVPVKSELAQSRLAIHCVRDGLVKARTAIRDLLAEVTRLDERITEYDQHIRMMAGADERSERLMTLSGIGPTTASALLASIGNGHDFRNGRQLAAWLGLVPGQYSSGGKQRLGRITKAGDRYLRTLLILGARAVLSAATKKQDRMSRWAVTLVERRGYWKAVVAVAAKNARMAWAVLSKGEDFKAPT